MIGWRLVIMEDLNEKYYLAETSRKRRNQSCQGQVHMQQIVVHRLLRQEEPECVPTTESAHISHSVVSDSL